MKIEWSAVSGCCRWYVACECTHACNDEHTHKTRKFPLGLRLRLLRPKACALSLSLNLRFCGAPRFLLASRWSERAFFSSSCCFLFFFILVCSDCTFVSVCATVTSVIVAHECANIDLELCYTFESTDDVSIYLPRSYILFGVHVCRCVHADAF